MENQSTKLDKALKISAVVGILLVALSVAYYMVIFLPQKERVRIEQQKQEQQAKEQKEKIENEILSQKEDDQAYIWMIQNLDDTRAKEVKNKLLEKNYKPTEPSERALKATTELYIYMTAGDKDREKEFMDSYSGGTGDLTTAIKNASLKCDIEADFLILTETTLAQVKKLREAPKVYIQQPNTPTYTPPASSSINCTTRKILDTTYTRCH